MWFPAGSRYIRFFFLESGWQGINKDLTFCWRYTVDNKTGSQNIEHGHGHGHGVVKQLRRGGAKQQKCAVCCSRRSIAVGDGQNWYTGFCRFFSNISNRKIIAGEREKDYQITIRQLLDGLLGQFQV